MTSKEKEVEKEVTVEQSNPSIISETENLELECIRTPEVVADEALIDELNFDCLRHIFNFLTIKDKAKVELVCKRWQELSLDSYKSIKTLNKNSRIWGFRASRKKRKEMTIIFRQILPRCGCTLRRINLSSMRLKSSVLHNLAEICPNLQSINTGNLNLTLRAIRNMTDHCHDLRELTFTRCSDKCTDMELIKFFHQTKKLCYLKVLCNFNLTGAFLEGLTSSMKTVILSDCPSLSSHRVYEAIMKLENLRVLTFTENYFWAPDLWGGKTIESLPTNLVSLKLSPTLTLDNKAIDSLRNLRTLDISVSSIKDTFLEKLAQNCKELLHLNLSGCKNLTDDGIIYIRHLPKLEELKIQKLTVTDQALTFFPKIKRLSCSKCYAIRDEGLCTLISSCDSIEMLNCANCGFITNDLVDCAIQATRLRTNGVVLKLNVRWTSVDPDRITDESQLLHLILSPRIE